jgi:acetyltransferase-like isoleucine patch superfamily enzyme
MGKKIINFTQRRMGAAYLEERSLKEIIKKGIVGRIIQWCAMTRLPVTSGVRTNLQRLRGITIGKNVFLAGSCFLDPVKPELITIEDWVSISGNVTILTHSRPTQPLREIMEDGGAKIAPVVIKRGAWLGVNSIILPGVTVGENSIVGAGAVVTKNVPPNTIVAGVPARAIKKIN